MIRALVAKWLAAIGLFLSTHFGLPHTNVITFDMGGSEATFIKDYAAGRQRGDNYIIDGMCVSGCTFIVGEIPRSRVCITPFARMGFHAAYTIDALFGRRFSSEGTVTMWQYYPPDVRKLLADHGWKDPNVDQPTLIWLGYDELKTLFRTCK